jgi:hypothetical protein
MPLANMQLEYPVEHRRASLFQKRGNSLQNVSEADVVPLVSTQHYVGFSYVP